MSGAGAEPGFTVSGLGFTFRSAPGSMASPPLSRLAAPDVKRAHRK